MEISAVKQAFVYAELPPKWAINAALACPQEAVPMLLAMVKEGIEHQNQHVCYSKDYILALYTLAKLRDHRIFPYFMQICRLPSDKLEELFGDIISEGFASIIVSVYNGDLAALKELIEDEAVGIWVRAAAMQSLLGLCVTGALSRDAAINYFDTLLDRALQAESIECASDCNGGCDGDCEEDCDCMCDCSRDQELFVALLIDRAAALYSPKLFTKSYQAFEQDIVDVNFIGEHSIREMEQLGEEECLKKYLYEEKYHLPVEDVIAEIGWLYRVRDDSPRWLRKIGRNDQCPCMSGQKYKKCCA